VRLGGRVVMAGAVRVVAAGVLVSGMGLLLFRMEAVGVWAAEDAPARASLTIDYPLNGSVFPPEITAPTFLWHDRAEGAKRWVVEIRLEKSAPGLRIECAGELMKLGEIDTKAGPGVGLTPEQASSRTWRPDAATWEQIKLQSTKEPAGITIEGIDEQGKVVSTGHVAISTSTDPVGAPLFYRDVPLMLPSPDQKGPITPLPQEALPLIKWRTRNIAEPESKVVMENLPTCANCHSFSRDGKTFGLDMDGPRNDKGLYALLPVLRQMTISNHNMIHWSSFQLNDEARAGDAAVKRFGFMSQVSPDGRYVVTSVGPPNNTNRNEGKGPAFAPGILDRLFSTNYNSIAFGQVFYPTKGILAWYDREAGTMKPLPGADDPRYVHTSAFWSPDGKWLIFSRAAARNPYPPGVPKPMYANDPNETQIQYDLYKIPFNEGHGGKAVPVEGASGNGKSNNFPKVSPDGKWIIFVECKNGLLMRPDSVLYIVPFEGGTARPLNANTKLMNSWHSFSPNGRWLAFSSKGRGPYTQLMLTHLDADGNDTPAVMVDNTTAANRAVNIPEFLNVPEGQEIAKIDPQATEFYSLFDKAFKLMQAGNLPEAIATIKQAIERDPDDALAHYVLATALSGNDQEAEALKEYRRAVELEPKSGTYRDHLAVSMDLNGDPAGAIVELHKAIEADPTSAEFHFNLGVVLESRGDYQGAIGPLMESIRHSRGKNWRSFAELGKAFSKTGRRAEAVQAIQEAISLAEQAHEDEAVGELHKALAELERKGTRGSQ
jgi:Flp pilus assembly protein TadD